MFAQAGPAGEKWLDRERQIPEGADGTEGAWEGSGGGGASNPGWAAASLATARQTG